MMGKKQKLFGQSAGPSQAYIRTTLELRDWVPHGYPLCYWLITRYESPSRAKLQVETKHNLKQEKCAIVSGKGVIRWSVLRTMFGVVVAAEGEGRPRSRAVTGASQMSF